MQINKDEIRTRWYKDPQALGLTATAIAKRAYADINALLASDDAKDETIRQQAADLDAMREMAVKWEQKADKLARQNAQQAAEIERLKAIDERESEITINVHLENSRLRERLQAAERERDEARDGSWKAIAEMAERENAALRECLANVISAVKDADSDISLLHYRGYIDYAKRGCIDKSAIDRLVARLRKVGEDADALLAELDRKDTQSEDVTDDDLDNMPDGSEVTMGCRDCESAEVHRKINGEWICQWCGGPVEDTQGEGGQT